MTADWIALDWGTTHLRGWAMSGSGSVIDTRSSEAGMNRLAPEAFEPALLELADGWIDGPVTAIACGMVGARQGWIEAAYTPVPAAPLGAGLTPAPTQRPGLDVLIVPGMCQSSPPDVMRGEETQIAGFIALNPGWDGILCLPGTHTKWVEISAGEVISFQTAMTGDLYAAISEHTVLRHSVAAGGWSDEAFDTALSEAMSRPERLASRLFGIRAAGLVGTAAEGTARATLSGLLIGAELASVRPYWLGRQIAVIGDRGLSGLYVRALATQGAPATITDAERITLAGLTAAWRHWKGGA